LKAISRLCLLILLQHTALIALFAQKPQARREVAVTFDDLPVVGYSELKDQQRITRNLLKHIRSYRVPAIGFVNEVKLYKQDKPDSARIALLQQWLDAGLELGNHTFSHPDLHLIPLEDFLEEITRGETQTRALLAKQGSQIRYFRHPFLHTGRELAVKEKLESFLTGKGYRVAPVTIDNSDWLFARAYDLALKDANKRMQQRILDAYIPYMERKIAYYEKQSLQFFGREIRQVLLLHSNAINADGFGRLASVMKKRGYNFVTMDRALEDPAYGSADTFVGPGGISWLHRWVLSSGKKELIVPDEPRTPDFVQKQAKTTE
jgi:peptidoglycan/xylan/chitin deacetylase (PgdA/CDA1 family)